MLTELTERERRERLESDVRLAASLSDADRIRILRDLLRTVDAIRRGKSPEELRREDDARRALAEPGRRRYVALAERLG
ncbi:MAG: hypothetical protein O7J95_20415 [Planctomycetota bacterium]|nr:hypothetical protein [Planctomycetota bacterium]